MKTRICVSVSRLTYILKRKRKYGGEIHSYIGICTKTFSYSTRTVSSSKAKAVSVLTGKLLKCWVWSKESTFEKMYKEIIPGGTNFQISISASFEERPSQQ